MCVLYSKPTELWSLDHRPNVAACIIRPKTPSLNLTHLSGTALYGSTRLYSI